MTETDGLEHISRRVLLKATGAVTVGSAAFTGLASAHPPEEIRFCGCSQVCVSSDESYRIVYATEGDDGYTCRVAPGTDETEHTTPDCFTAGEDEKVIGVLGGNRNFYHNPNTCAEKALDDVDLNDCTGCEDDNCDSTVTYERRGQHEYEVVGGDVVVRTRLCKPPEKWDDDPNGPPERNGRRRGKKKRGRGDL